MKQIILNETSLFIQVSFYITKDSFKIVSDKDFGWNLNMW